MKTQAKKKILEVIMCRNNYGFIHKNVIFTVTEDQTASTTFIVIAIKYIIRKLYYITLIIFIFCNAKLGMNIY